MRKASNTGFGSHYSDMTPKAQVAMKIRKMDFIEIKNICASKDTLSTQVRKQPEEWEKRK